MLDNGWDEDKRVQQRCSPVYMDLDIYLPGCRTAQQGGLVEGKAQARPRPGLAGRSRGPVEATRATTIIIGFPRAERVFNEKLVPETRSCAPVVLAVVSRPLGSMKDRRTAAICVVQARMARRRGWYQV